MASHKFELDFDELQDVIKDLEKVGGNVQQATEKALEKSHAYITPLIEKKLDKSNLPSGGKYSSKDRKHSLKQVIKEPNIIWVGQTCYCDVGFNLDKTIVPIFLIQGTNSQKHNMSPVPGLKALLEGKGAQKKVAEIQSDVFFDEILKVYER